MAASALLIVPAGVWADNVVGDGDGIAPVSGNSVNFGTVCLGSTATKGALVAIQRAGSGQNTFANNAVVTVKVTTVSGAGVSTTPAAGGTVGTITLPSNWSGASNNTMSAAVAMSVSLTAVSAGTVTGSVGLSATGGSLTRTGALAVSANVVNCDTTPPTLVLPPNPVVEATGPTGASVSFTATAFDENPTSPPVTCNRASGSTFVLGTTTVTCSATDAAGNTATGSFTVTVRDTTAPVIAATVDITGVEATSGNGAVVTYTPPTATDLVSGSVTVSCGPPSGSTFALGATSVTCSATDTAGNSSTRQFKVEVVDTTAPVLVVPATVTAEATSSHGAGVTYTVPDAEDAVDGAVTATCTPASGSTFALGTNTVTCTASDAAGNTTTGSFAVIVRDTTPPTISGTPTARTAEATGPGGAAVNYASPTASDLVDGVVPVSCTPASGSTFALGTNTVTCSATDAAGNTASTSFTITVQDTTPPALTVPADHVVTATGINGATATFHAQAVDLVDGSVPVICAPGSGSVFPIGFTTVVCTATDTMGNTATASFTVNVRRTILGFHQPVDMSRTLNTVKGGSTVPIKFEVFAGSTEMTTTDIILPISLVQFSCPDGAPIDDVEIIATGNTSLRYDTSGGQYIYNWQTPKVKGSCYQVMISTTDKASVVAWFKTT